MEISWSALQPWGQLAPSNHTYITGFSSDPSCLTAEFCGLHQAQKWFRAHQLEAGTATAASQHGEQNFCVRPAILPLVSTEVKSWHCHDQGVLVPAATCTSGHFVFSCFSWGIFSSGLLGCPWIYWEPLLPHPFLRFFPRETQDKTVVPFRGCKGHSCSLGRYPLQRGQALLKKLRELVACSPSPCWAV